MRSFCGLLMLLVLGFNTRAQDKPEYTGEIKNDTGVINVVVGHYVIELYKDPGHRYAAENLDTSLKVLGLKVIFSGLIGKIPPNVRMIATPFTITSIRKLEGGFMPPVMDFGWYKQVSNVKAVVHFLTDKETVVIIPDSNPNMRYLSQQLPTEFKKEGLKITFSGWLGKIPPNVMMLGTPLKITKLCISKTEAKKFGIKKTCYAFNG